MLSDDSQTPTRSELLSMVRKHSKTIGQTVLDEDDTLDDVEMDPKFWHDMVDLYFVRGRDAKGHQDDDLLFFVRKMLRRPADSADDNSPYFVRRWAPKLDNLIGDSSADIDWRRSFYLNLIAHTSFSVTVAICSNQVLKQYKSGEGKPLSPVYKVVKTVYASPSRVNFHLDSRKEVETTPAYPDICFAVDDFDSTFDAVVLTDTDHCYCVILNAHEGGALTSDNTDQHNSSVVSSSETVASPSSSERVASPGKIKNPKITLFSGFISYQMVRDAYEGKILAGRSGFGSLLSLGHSSGKTDRIYMNGPGGRGEVEVAVSGVLDQSKVDPGPHSPIQISKKGLGLGTIVRNAASVASSAAKQAYAAASAQRPSEEEMLPLKCCLMSISLPWEYIAHDLLFK